MKKELHSYNTANLNFTHKHNYTNQHQKPTCQQSIEQALPGETVTWRGETELALSVQQHVVGLIDQAVTTKMREEGEGREIE